MYKRQIQERLLAEVADLHGVPEGAYNIRANGKMAGRSTTANIDITTKTDKPGIDIKIKPGTKHESVHIPVVVSASGLKEMVYNDFYIGEDSDVVIVAGSVSYTHLGIVFANRVEKPAMQEVRYYYGLYR